MMELTLLQKGMVERIKEKGLQVLGAFPTEGKKDYAAPLVVVSIRAMQLDPAGFQNYLGERWDQGRDVWEEIYGRKAQVRFGLDIYSPRRYGEGGCQEMMDGLAALFQEEAPLGLVAQSLSWDNVSYDRSCDMFCRKGEALCEGQLFTVTDLDGSFLCFEVRGGITLE